ncbi:MAG TPA: hypothetical protein VE987_05850 [Polyangiaceae bacterium]|nr:hypothetical protein [Polyangiaceae bacterium]
MKRWGFGRASIALGALLASAGCSDVFGFNREVTGVECFLDSDCPGSLVCRYQVCKPECGGGKDCSSGVCGGDGVCISKAAADVADAAEASSGQGADAVAPPATGEAGPAPAADVAAADASPDASDDASACAPACPPRAACLQSTCHQAVAIGYSSGADTTVEVGTGGELACVELSIAMPACGYLTGVGFVVDIAVDGQFRFAIYEDGGGHPAQRVAQTSEQTIVGNGADLDVSPPVLVGCAPNALAAYWICFASSLTSFFPAALSTASASWVFGLAPPAQVQAYLQSGLPAGDPTAGSPAAGYAPLIYAWFASTAP